MKYHAGNPLRHVGNVPAMGANRYGDALAFEYRDEEYSYAAIARRNGNSGGSPSSACRPMRTRGGSSSSTNSPAAAPGRSSGTGSRPMSPNGSTGRWSRARSCNRCRSVAAAGPPQRALTMGLIGHPRGSGSPSDTSYCRL